MKVWQCDIRTDYGTYRVQGTNTRKRMTDWLKLEHPVWGGNITWRRRERWKSVNRYFRGMWFRFVPKVKV